MWKKICLLWLFALISLTLTSCGELLTELEESLELEASIDLLEEDVIILNTINEQHDSTQDDDIVEWGELHRFMEDELWGFKDADGNIVIEPQYIAALPFSEGLSFVMGAERQSDLTGFIDVEGNLVIPLPTAIQGGVFSEGFARVTIREWRSDEDPAAVGTYGPFIFIDRAGNDVFGKEFASGVDFKNGVTRVSSGTGWFFMDTTGANIFGDIVFRFAWDFDEDGYASVRLFDRTLTYIDRQGNIIDR